LLALLSAACGEDGEQSTEKLSAEQASAIATGKALVQARVCTTCHGTDLSGSAVAYPGTAVYASNLTPDTDTGLGAWSDAQLLAAVLDGVDDDGAQLCSVMPTYRAMGMSEEQAQKVVAYLRSLPAKKHAVPEKQGCTK
jgi:mono/diheme cytochrome c family protein